MRIFVALLVGVWVSSAAADPIIFDNGLPGLANGLSSQLDNFYPFNSQTADDFVLQAGANKITDLHWWGLWWNPGPPGNPTAFNAIIYADAGGMPTGAGMADPTPTALKVWTVAPALVNETFYANANGFNWYSYDLNVSADPFVANPGQRYWLVFQSVNQFPPQWGWAATAAAAGTAMQGFPLLGTPYWTPMNTEMAFYITGVPEPTSLLLLGLGALLFRRR